MLSMPNATKQTNKQTPQTVVSRRYFKLYFLKFAEDFIHSIKELSVTFSQDNVS